MIAYIVEFGQNAVGHLDLIGGNLSEWHLVQVNLKEQIKMRKLNRNQVYKKSLNICILVYLELFHLSLHRFDVENEANKILDGLGQFGPHLAAFDCGRETFSIVLVVSAVVHLKRIEAIRLFHGTLAFAPAVTRLLVVHVLEFSRNGVDIRIVVEFVSAYRRANTSPSSK